MKQFILSVTLSVFAAFVFAQNQSYNYNPFPKTISVTGSAEMEVVPDEIYVQIDLHEYKKKGGDKIELDKIKNDFLALYKKTGITDSTISIASYDGSNGGYDYWKKKKSDPNLFSSIAYQIKLKDSKTMDKLVDGLDDDATANFQIVKVSNSKIQEYRRQLKLQAIKEAKEKGNDLTKAINEQLGAAVTINEPEEIVFDVPQYSRFKAQYSNANATTETVDAGSVIDFKKIKLRFEVKVVFALI